LGFSVTACDNRRNSKQFRRFFLSDIIFDFDAVYLSDDDFFVGGRFRYVRLIVG
jgi:hypothetical protein